MGFTIFTPIGTTKNVSASSTTGNVELPIGGDRSVRVYNSLSERVYIDFGGSTIEAAVATSLPLGPGAVEYFQLGKSVTHMAAITGAGSGTVYATEGQGS